MSAGDIFGDQAKDFHFARVAGTDKLTDLYNRPLMESCELEGVAFDKEAFWHSSAHLLGYAIEMYYKDSMLTVGPPTDEGFFYDFGLPDGKAASQNDFADIEAIVKDVIKQKHRFERLELTREQALDMFSENAFKTRILQNKVAEDEMTSVYKVGDFIDLCTGPHLPHSGLVKAFKLTKNSAVH